MDQNSDRLLSVAGAIADGTAVSWEDEQRHVGDEDFGSTLRGLQEIAAILAAQRVIQREYDITTKNETAARAQIAPPTHWRHLVVLDKIGEGSFGAVYRAYDNLLALDVALKLISPSPTARAKNPDRVLREARLLAKVRHSNVVTVFGADQTDEYVGVWMEFIKGRTLGELLKTQGTFGAYEAALIGRDLCRAVAAVHQAGILHGDIKAHNVMRQEGGRTVLMDFGAGRPLMDDQSAGGVRNIVGTPMYLAPEVLDGHPPSTSSDIYSLGVLLYHLVTGSYPIAGNSLPQIIEAHKRGERRRLRDTRPDLPDDFVRVVEQGMAVDPAQRFGTAGAFEDALARITSSPAPAPRPPDKKPLVNAPRWVMMALALIVMAAATGVWLTHPTSQPLSAGVTPSALPSTTSTVTGFPVAGEYQIDAAFFRARPTGNERLTPGDRVIPGDELFLKFQASVPVYLYVVNEDEEGASFLLFPLPGQRPTNPIEPSQVTLPATARWVVDKVGGQEHFLVFASPDRLESFEQVFASLPSPKENTPVQTARLEPGTIDRLRSVGGLTPEPPKPGVGKGLARLFTTPLTNAPETAHGLWVRQITLDNPTR